MTLKNMFYWIWVFEIKVTFMIWHSLAELFPHYAASTHLEQKIVIPLRSSFWEVCFPQQKGDMWRTLWKHFHNFLINHLFLSQLNFWINKLWLITYVWKLFITINQLQKMIDHSKYLNGNQALLKCKGHMTVELC